MKKILLVVNSGLGDAISVIPVIKTIRYKYPDIKMYILSHKAYAKDIFENLVDGIVVELVSFYDYVFIFAYVSVFSFSQILKYKLSNIQSKIISSVLPNNIIAKFAKKIMFYTRTIDYNKHITWNNLRLLQYISIDSNDFILSNSLAYDNGVSQINDKYIVFNIGASSGAPTPKSISDKIWFELSQNIETHKIVLVGDAKDLKPWVSNLSSNPNVINLVGKTSIRELLNIISYAGMTITADSGFAHLSSTIVVKQLVLWGPTLFNFNHPVNLSSPDSIEFLFRSMHCSPCCGGYLMSESLALEKCDYNKKCMDFPVTTVINKVKSILEIKD